MISLNTLSTTDLGVSSKHFLLEKNTWKAKHIPGGWESERNNYIIGNNESFMPLISFSLNFDDIKIVGFGLGMGMQEQEKS